MPSLREPPALVGRAADAVRAREAAAASRLVTLIGPPGVGKTALARSIANARAADTTVVVIDLGGVATEADAEEAAARAIAGARGVSVTLLRERNGWGVPRWAEELPALGRAALVLDECEAHLAAAARLCGYFLEGSDAASVLATSREPLGLPEEIVVRLEPLAVPPVGASDEEIERSPAVRMLRAVPAGGALDTLAAIARRLDGLPVALELAANLLETLTPAQLIQRLEKVALSGAVRASLMSSWEPLDAEARSVLVAASCFEGAFALEALEAVLPTALAEPAFQIVAALRQKSLLHIAGDPPSYRLLSLVRSFTRAEAERDDTLREIAAAFPERLIAHAEREVAKDRPSVAFEPELLAFVERSHPGGSNPLALRALRALCTTLRWRGEYERIGALVARALSGAASAPVVVDLRVHLAHARANLLELDAATDEAERALAEARKLGDARAELTALQIIADLRARASDEPRARGALGESTAIVQQIGGVDLELDALSATIAVEWRTGTAAGAQHAAITALALAERAGKAERASYFRTLMGQTFTITGPTADAELHLEQAAADARRQGAMSLAAAARISTGLLKACNERFGPAAADLREALALSERMGLPRPELWAMSYLGTLEWLDRGDATRLEAAALRARLDEPLLLLVPLFAALANRRVGASMLEEGLSKLARPIREIGYLGAFAAFCRDAVRFARGEQCEDLSGAAARALRDRLPPAFQPDLTLCGLMLDRAPGRAREVPRRLTVAVDGAWFRSADGTIVSLAGSPTSRRLLACLVAARRDALPRMLSLDELRSAAWPGDRSRKDAAANRVYVALSRLRDRGLREVLVRDARGWQIDPATELELVAGDAPG